MTSIHPSTFSPYFVDYRAALADGKVTKQEAVKKFLPHAAAVESDPTYRREVEALVNGSTRLPAGGIAKVTAAARTVLQQMLANAQTSRV